MSAFVFQKYAYDLETKQASFYYQSGGRPFKEVITFEYALEAYDESALDGALQLAFFIIGTSYYKAFPTQTVRIESGSIDAWQAKFLSSVYQEGLSQFAFENQLARDDLAHFTATVEEVRSAAQYHATDEVPLVLQSGGKDSLLLAKLLSKKNLPFTPLYIASGESHPAVLDELSAPLGTIHRSIDKMALQEASAAGGLNGHVPVTYIVAAISLIQAVLLGKGSVLAAIGHEGEEPYGFIGDLPVAHQWSKTWQAEEQLAQYIARYISPNLQFGSPLRKYSELKIAELFVTHCWQEYARKFSSCNVYNYKQGKDNSALGWCGNCAKCANSFLLFAPFVKPDQLSRVFNGENLFQKESLQEVFKGLLGVEGATKPFECIGEEAELRTAYHMAHAAWSEYELPFLVPEDVFDYQKEYPAQSQLSDLIGS